MDAMTRVLFAALVLSGCAERTATPFLIPHPWATVDVTVVDSRTYGDGIAGATVSAWSPKPIAPDGANQPALTDAHGVAHLRVTWDGRRFPRIWVAVTHPTFAPLTAQYLDLQPGHTYVVTVPMTPWPPLEARAGILWRR
jgi:hypothetical protein